MTTRKKYRKSRNNSSDLRQLDLEQFVKMDELPLEQSLQMLREAGIDVCEEEAKQIMDFLYLLARITIKEIFSPDQKFL